MATIEIDERVAPLLADAQALAGEHGHVLGEWYSTGRLITAARCTQCTATVSLRARGYGSNADPTFALRRNCTETGRYFVTKSNAGISGTTQHFVHDRERPQHEPVAMKRKAADANAIAKALNGGPVDELAKMHAKVERLRKQLAKAETELASVAA